MPTLTIEELLREHGIMDDERTPCEVWTRVMGYHRPVSAFNPGKQAEHEARLHYQEKGWKNERPI